MSRSELPAVAEIRIRSGDEYVAAADASVLPVSALALKLLVNLHARGASNPPEVGFHLDRVVLNAFVRWQEDREPGVAALGDRLSDALGWLISQALLVPSRDEGVW